MIDPTFAMYYVNRTKKLLRAFDLLARRFRRAIAARDGESFAREVMAETRAGYERILPELPYIGGADNIFTWVIEFNGALISLHRAMKARGKAAEDAVRINLEVFGRLLGMIPKPGRHLCGRLLCSPRVIRTLREQAALSQERRYPEDFVYTVEVGGDDDLALIVSECAVVKLYKAQDVLELAPFCNFADVTYGRLMNMGIDAHRTIGLGHDICELRYTLGRPVAIPDRLGPLMP